MTQQPTRESTTAAVLAKPYPWPEEIANSLSHGAGVLFGIFALVLLVLKSVQMDDTLRVVAFTIYGASVVLLFLASTLYHAIPVPRAKQVLKLVDHCAIYLLIAGSYTPFLLVTLGDTFGAVLMVVIWSLAVAGIVFKVFFLHRFHNLSLALYLGMGWLAVLASYQLLANLPRTGIALLLGRRHPLLAGNDLLQVGTDPV